MGLLRGLAAAGCATRAGQAAGWGGADVFVFWRWRRRNSARLPGGGGFPAALLPNPRRRVVASDPGNATVKKPVGVSGVIMRIMPFGGREPCAGQGRTSNNKCGPVCENPVFPAPRAGAEGLWTGRVRPLASSGMRPLASSDNVFSCSRNHVRARAQERCLSLTLAIKCALRPAPCALCPTLALNCACPAPCALCPTLALNCACPAPCALCPTLALKCALRPAPCALRPVPGARCPVLSPRASSGPNTKTCACRNGTNRSFSTDSRWPTIARISSGTVEQRSQLHTAVDPDMTLCTSGEAAPRLLGLGLFNGTVQ